MNTKKILFNEITDKQLEVFRLIYNNPKMTKEQVGHKVQAVRLHKQAQNKND